MVKRANVERSLYDVLPWVLLCKLTLLGATLMSMAGVHREVVSERLGHASVGITFSPEMTC